jgi:LysM repeat protein
MILALCSLLLVHAVSVLSVEQPQVSSILSQRHPHQYANDTQNSIDRRDFNPICSSYIVSEGDSCTSIAAKCDITTGLLTTYNKGVDCAKNVGKPMCCSTGGTPVPPRDVEGVCYKYTIRGEDTCERIAKAYGITIANIEAWNKETWAWYGCGDLQIGGNICLTEKGVRPMPVSIPGAVCGPQVPGTARPTEWKKLPSLNPCPSSQCVSLINN